MSLNSALYGLVTADATISGLISTRFYPATGQQSDTKPYTVYQRISSPRSYVQGYQSSLSWPRYQLTHVAATQDGARALADAFRDLLSGYNGTAGGVHFRATFLEQEADDFHDGLNEYTVRQDYILWHAESYAMKVYDLAPIAYWRLNETTGTTADNFEGTAGLDGTYSNVTLGAGQFVNGEPAGLWATASNSYCNIYSTALNTALDGDELTVIIWAKIAASVWTDGVARYMIHCRVDGSNNFLISKSATSNTVTFSYAGGAVTDVVNHTFSDTGWNCFGMTVSKTADAMKAYVNGAQVGSTQTGIGTFAGALAAAQCGIGNNGTAGAADFAGYLHDGALWDSPLTAAQMERLGRV